MQLAERFTTDVERCARCGRNHRELRVSRLTRGESDREQYTHWAICPTNGEPLLFRAAITDETGGDLKSGS